MKKITFKSFMDNIFIPIAFIIGTYMDNSITWLASGDYNIYIKGGIRLFSLYLLISGIISIIKGGKNDRQNKEYNK